jgi:hypothetical protein
LQFCCSCILRVLSSKRTKKTLRKNVLLVACVITVVCTIVAPWEALPEVWEQLPHSVGRRRRAPRRWCQRILERPPSMLKTSMAGPWEVLSKNPRAPTINARKHQQRTPWEVLPKNPGAPTINTRKHRRRVPWEAVSENLRATTINAKKHRWWTPWGATGESRRAHHQR